MRRFVFCLIVVFLVFHTYAEPVFHHISYDGLQDVLIYVNNEFQRWYEDLTGKKVSIKQYYVSNRYELLANIASVPFNIVSSLYPINLELLNYEMDTDVFEFSMGKLLPVESPGYVIFNFVVREGNPKGILDWSDIARNDIDIVSSNYLYSDIGRMIYLNAWFYAQEQGMDEYLSMEYISNVVENTILQTMSMGMSENSFVASGLGDVLITTEFNARRLGRMQNLQTVVPPLDLKNIIYFYLHENNSNNDYIESSNVASAYLVFLQTEEIQDYLANNGVYNDTIGAMTQIIALDEKKESMMYLEHFGANGILTTIRRNLQNANAILHNTRAQEDLNP